MCRRSAAAEDEEGVPVLYHCCHNTHADVVLQDAGRNNIVACGLLLVPSHTKKASATAGRAGP